MPSYVRVTNLANNRSLIVRVNDRGPYHANREIDVSQRAAQLLDFHRKGVARVRVEYVAPAPLEGSDDRRLIATLREGAPAPAPSAVMLASAKPFLPRTGDAPLPPERPFDLGHGSADGRVAAAAPRRYPQVATAPLPGVAYAEARPALRSSRTPEAGTLRVPSGSGSGFGYAPTSNMGSNTLATGRGLY
jgi:rare lipoprotein A